MLFRKKKKKEKKKGHTTLSASFFGEEEVTAGFGSLAAFCILFTFCSNEFLHDVQTS